MEEVDDLRQGFLGLVLARHILEGDAGGLLHINLGVGFPHAADASNAAHAFFRHPAHNQAHHQDDDEEGGQVHQKQQNGAHGGLVVLVDADARSFRLDASRLPVQLLNMLHNGVIGLELDGEELQGQLHLPALPIYVGVNGGSVLLGGFGVFHPLAVGVDIAVHRGDDEDGFAVVKIPPGHLAKVQHVQKLAVLQLHRACLVAHAGHISGGVAYQGRQQHRPADQVDKAPPVAVFVLVRLFLVVVLVHV